MTAGAIRVQSTAQVQPTIKGSTISIPPAINNCSNKFRFSSGRLGAHDAFRPGWFRDSSGVGDLRGGQPTGATTNVINDANAMTFPT
jgi:hypothetical protein